MDFGKATPVVTAELKKYPTSERPLVQFLAWLDHCRPRDNNVEELEFLDKFKEKFTRGLEDTMVRSQEFHRILNTNAVAIEAYNPNRYTGQNDKMKREKHFVRWANVLKKALEDCKHFVKAFEEGTIAKVQAQRNARISSLFAKLQRLIAERTALDVEEVDFDREGKSCYVKAGRLDKKIWATYQEYAVAYGFPKPDFLKAEFRCHGDLFPGLSDLIEESVNSNDTVPDFWAVKDWIKGSTLSCGESTASEFLDKLAKENFEKVIIQMKAWRRGKEEAQWGRTLEFYAKGRVWEPPADPAADCPELEAKLQANRVIAKAKMSKALDDLCEAPSVKKRKLSLRDAGSWQD